MAALAVIYRNIFKQPGRISARADLEHFRAGKIYLERDLFHRSSEATLGGTMRNLFDNMLESAERLLGSDGGTRTIRNSSSLR